MKTIAQQYQFPQLNDGVGTPDGSLENVQTPSLGYSFFFNQSGQLCKIDTGGTVTVVELTPTTTVPKCFVHEVTSRTVSIAATATPVIVSDALFDDLSEDVLAYDNSSGVIRNNDTVAWDVHFVFSMKLGPRVTQTPTVSFYKTDAILVPLLPVPVTIDASYGVDIYIEHVVNLASTEGVFVQIYDDIATYDVTREYTSFRARLW